MKTSHLVSIAASLMLAATAFADAPPSGSVTIEDIDYSGQGCPQGSVATNISDDGKAMTVLFDEYYVESEGRPGRKGCDLDVTLNAPPGWTYSLFCVDVRGYASLDDNVVGKQSVEYSFGQRRGRWGGHGRSIEVGGIKLEGPFDDDYENLTAIPLETVVWAPCGQTAERTLKIKTDITIQPRGGRRNRGGGFMTVDSVDGELQHHYGIAWKRCPGQGDGDNGDIDYSGFSTSKDMNLGRRVGQCSKTWKSTRSGELVVSEDSCTDLLNRADRRVRRILEMRINLWDRVVDREFEQWKRQQERGGNNGRGAGGPGRGFPWG